MEKYFEEYEDSSDQYNLWVICCNCEYEVLIEEVFYDSYTDGLCDSNIDCPCCGSKEMRKGRY